MATLIVALGIAAPSNAIAAEDHSDSSYTTEDVSFENAGLTLNGTVLVPSMPGATSTSTTTTPSVETRHPAVVIVAGSGVRVRSDYLAEARAFAAAGVVTLIYDKRTVGYSLTERSYAQLGDDAIAGLRLLRARPDVDPARVGLWGHSEGGWVVPLAAASHPEVGFVILTGASARPPAEVQTWSTCRYLVNSGFPERLCAPVGGNLTRLMVAGGLFPEAGFDPLPALAQLRVPTLVLLAEFDQSTAPVTSGHLFADALSGSPHASVCVVPGADHEFRASPNGFEAEERYADGYLQLAPTWVGVWVGPPSTARPPPPHSRWARRRGSARSTGSKPSPCMPWPVSCCSAFLSYPISALVRRMSGLRRPGPAAWPARVLSAAGLVTVLGTVCLLGYLMSTGATDPIGPVLLDRPAVWLLLQLLSLVVVGAAAWTAVTWWRTRDRITGSARIRLGTVMVGAIVFVPWAAWWVCSRSEQSEIPSPHHWGASMHPHLN